MRRWELSENISGRCLCGAVSYETTAPPMLVGKCYCVDCRKASATGHGTHMVMPEDAYRLTGELKFYDHPADSGNIVSRGFCPQCGCAIHSTNSGMPGMVFIRASSLDDVEAISAAMSVYASRAPSWDQPVADLPSFAEMPEGGPEAVIPQ